MELSDPTVSFIEKEQYVAGHMEEVIGSIRTGLLSKEDKFVLCDIAERNLNFDLLEELVLFKGLSQIFADELVNADEQRTISSAFDAIRRMEVRHVEDEKIIIARLLATPNLPLLVLKSVFSLSFIESMTRTFYDSEKAVRLKCTEVLGRLKTDRAKAILLNVLDDPAEPVRDAALEVLKKQYDEADYLDHLIKKEKDATELKQIVEGGRANIQKLASHIPYVKNLMAIMDGSLLKARESLNTLANTIGGRLDRLFKQEAVTDHPEKTDSQI